jgi:hypothetical protein
VSSKDNNQKELGAHALLLAAADLEERRLLLAELLEAGYQVAPVPGLEFAVRAMLGRSVRPSAILLDAVRQTVPRPAGCRQSGLGLLD